MVSGLHSLKQTKRIKTTRVLTRKHGARTRFIWGVARERVKMRVREGVHGLSKGRWMVASALAKLTQSRAVVNKSKSASIIPRGGCWTMMWIMSSGSSASKTLESLVVALRFLFSGRAEWAVHHHRHHHESTLDRAWSISNNEFFDFSNCCCGWCWDWKRVGGGLSINKAERSVMVLWSIDEQKMKTEIEGWNDTKESRGCKEKIECVWWNGRWT